MSDKYIIVPVELTKPMHDAIDSSGEVAYGHARLNWLWKQLLAAAPKSPAIPVSELRGLVEKWRSPGNQPHDEYLGGVWDSLMDCANELEALLNKAGDK